MKTDGLIVKPNMTEEEIEAEAYKIFEYQLSLEETLSLPNWETRKGIFINMFKTIADIRTQNELMRTGPSPFKVQEIKSPSYMNKETSIESKTRKANRRQAAINILTGKQDVAETPVIQKSSFKLVSYTWYQLLFKRIKSLFVKPRTS